MLENVSAHAKITQVINNVLASLMDVSWGLLRGSEPILNRIQVLPAMPRYLKKAGRLRTWTMWFSYETLRDDIFKFHTFQIWVFHLPKRTYRTRFLRVCDQSGTGERISCCFRWRRSATSQPSLSSQDRWVWNLVMRKKTWRKKERDLWTSIFNEFHVSWQTKCVGNPDIFKFQRAIWEKASQCT